MVRISNGFKLSKHPNRFNGEVEDLQGQRFGELIVLDIAGKDSHGRAIWNCQCSCGKECKVRARSLKSGQVISCGHVNRQKAAERMGKLNYKHGASNEPWFSNYLDMLNRVYHPNDREEPYYNKERIYGRLIDPEWEKDPWAFYREIGPKPDLHATVDRIDGRKGYVPGNVRWASHEVQAVNRRYRAEKLGNINIQGIRFESKGINRRSHDRYNAVITVNKKRISLGHFLDLDNAKRARYDAESKYGFPHTFKRPEGPITEEPDYTHGDHPGIVFDKNRNKYRVYLDETQKVYIGQCDMLENAQQMLQKARDQYAKDSEGFIKKLKSRRHHNGIIGIDPQGEKHYYESIAQALRELGTHANLYRHLDSGKPFTAKRSKLYGWRFVYTEKDA